MVRTHNLYVGESFRRQVADDPASPLGSPQPWQPLDAVIVFSSFEYPLSRGMIEHSELKPGRRYFREVPGIFEERKNLFPRQMNNLRGSELMGIRIDFPEDYGE